MKVRLRKNDLVQVIVGNERHNAAAGEQPTRGRVLDVDRRRGYVIVEGVNLRTHHTKVRQTQNGPVGGIEEREAPIHVSNVMLVDPETDKPVRIGVKVQDGKRVRYTKGTNASGALLQEEE